MKRIHIIGGKNHGKTTLVAELVQTLSAQGYRVGTIKHTHHQHELDAPGKDSFIHRQAGANVVGIVAKNLSAVFWATPDRCLDAEDKYEQFKRLMTDCDLVLVEGDQHTNAPKIEVWREDVGSMPLAAEDKSILAVVSDDFVPVECAVCPRHDLSSLLTILFQSLVHRNDTAIDEFSIPISKTP